MGRINAIPEGLLDLLKSKTDGQTPRELAEVVAPILTMDGFYNQDRLDYQSNTIAPFGVGATTGFIVPQDEVWQILNWGLFLQGVSDGQAGSVSLRLEKLPGRQSASATFAGSFEYSFATGSTPLQKWYSFPVPSLPLVLSGGIEMYARHDNFFADASANPSAALYVMYYRSSR